MSTDLVLPELISPEGLQVAQVYLMNGGSLEETAEELSMESGEVQMYLDKREVRAYVDRIYEETGFRNKHKIGKVMDEIIKVKLEEMDETGLGSGKDILEILALQHKMNMEYINAKMKLMEIEAKREQQQIQNQTNVQINAAVGSEGYNTFMDKLLNAG